MLRAIDRRRAVALAAGAFLSPVLADPSWSGVGPAMTSRLAAMREAMAGLERARHAHDVFWTCCEAAGAFEHDGAWDWYQAQPVRVAYRRALERAWSAVEAAFMTVPVTPADEDGVMQALATYEPIAPSAFAMQSARDLFTPPRFQSYPHEPLRRWLLSEPDETFAKSPMPGFLLRMRAERRLQSIAG